MMEGAVVWSYNPWRERPGLAGRSAAAVALCGALLLGTGLPAGTTAVLWVVCATTFAIALLPVECRVDPEGASRRTGWFRERRPWSAVRRAERMPRGILLSPFGSPHWLDAYRALFLPLPVRGADLSQRIDALLLAHGL